MTMRLQRLPSARLRVASIMAGGAIGALARAGLERAIPTRGGSWPWATFCVNLVGAFILGWATTRLAERIAPTRYWRLLLGTGFCGALTTFSTFQVEVIRLAEARIWWSCARLCTQQHRAGDGLCNRRHVGRTLGALRMTEVLI